MNSEKVRLIRCLDEKIVDSKKCLIDLIFNYPQDKSTIMVMSKRVDYLEDLMSRLLKICPYDECGEF